MAFKATTLYDLTAFRQGLGIDLAAPIEVTAAEALADVVRATIERELNRYLIARSTDPYTELHTFRDRRFELFVRHPPIREVVSIKSSASRDWSNVTALVAEKDFVVSPIRGRVERLSSGRSIDLLEGESLNWPSGYVEGSFSGDGWTRGARANQVIYKGSYADRAHFIEALGHVSDVAVRLAVLKWREAKRQVQGITSWQDEAGNFTRIGPAKLTDEMKEEIRHDKANPESSSGELDVIPAIT